MDFADVVDVDLKNIHLFLPKLSQIIIWSPFIIAGNLNDLSKLENLVKLDIFCGKGKNITDSIVSDLIENCKSLKNLIIRYNREAE